MSKTLEIVMAGIMAGIVTYSTSVLGISGTIIGSVLGAILYQVMTHLFKEPLEDIKTQNVDAKIVYVFPLILIVVIELLFIFAKLYLSFGNLFYTLENVTDYNLFRSIGFALIIMGLYPLIQSENIKRVHGYIIIIVGFIVLLGGYADYQSPITAFYSVIFSTSGVLISIMVIAALLYVIITIILESVTIKRKNDNKISKPIKYIVVKEIPKSGNNKKSRGKKDPVDPDNKGGFNEKIE